MYRLLIILSGITCSLQSMQRLVDLNFLNTQYLQEMLQQTDRQITHAVCTKVFELCDKAYLDKNNYQCRFHYYFSFPSGYIIQFDIEEKISERVLCSYAYNRQSGEIRQLK